jgi:glutathionyl-hydroquinone reductase
MDQAKSQKFANEIIAAILGEYDQATYFFDIDPKDAKLPQGVEAKQVVQFKVTNDNVKQAAGTFITKALPKAIDVMSKDEYANMFQVNKEGLAKAKKNLQSNSGEVSKKLDELKNHLTVKQFDINTALNKDDIPVYQDLNANVELNDPTTKDNVKLSVTGYTQYSKINEKATFKVGIPTGDQVLTMEQLQQKMQPVAP